MSVRVSAREYTVVHKSNSGVMVNLGTYKDFEKALGVGYGELSEIAYHIQDDNDTFEALADEEGDKYRGVAIITDISISPLAELNGGFNYGFCLSGIKEGKRTLLDEIFILLYDKREEVTA